MEKYKYSSLTDEQHKKIMYQIDCIKCDDECEGLAVAGNIGYFIDELEAIEFIGKDESKYYRELISKAIKEGKRRWWYGNLS